jgi:hypothetical protein
MKNGKDNLQVGIKYGMITTFAVNSERKLSEVDDRPSKSVPHKANGGCVGWHSASGL